MKKLSDREMERLLDDLARCRRATRKRHREYVDAKKHYPHNTLLRSGDYVLLEDGSFVIIRSIYGYTVYGYDEWRDRVFALGDVVTLFYNVDDEGG